MKTSITVAALMLASPIAANSVPISSKVPGWKMGTVGAPIKMNLFYDLGCPDSRDAYYAWQKMFAEDSHVSGKKYSDLIDMTVSTFVLPYHLHSWTVTKAIPYLQDVCEADSSKCFMNSYSELCWEHWNTDL